MTANENKNNIVNLPFDLPLLPSSLFPNASSLNDASEAEGGRKEGARRSRLRRITQTRCLVIKAPLPPEEVGFSIEFVSARDKKDGCMGVKTKIIFEYV